MSELRVLDDDPFGPEILADPHDFLTRLREAGPLVRLSRYDVLAVGRYAEAYAALVDWQRCISSAGVGLADFRTEKPWRPPSLLLEADPPRHDAPRAVLTKVLSARALRRLREQWQADAAAVVDRALAGGGELDGVTDLAEAFPLRVFPDAVGLTPEGREHLLPYGSFAFNAFGPRNEIVTEAAKTVQPHVDWVSEQTARDRLAPGGFGAQIWEAADRGDITHEQAPLMVRSLLTAGVDTTVNGIAATLYALASNPSEYDRLRADPGLGRLAFEEAVRWESPVQTFFRTATAPVPLGGAEVPADQKLLVFLGSANRDPRHWSDPDRYDLTRDPSGHVGFGMGIHQCAGQHVARMEAEILLGEIARRVAKIELVGDPVRKLNNTLRSWQRLPLRLHAA
ncbi:cytochrome P450 [Propionibacteriaceae bacterium ES.041]|uniref:cytochrome P450 n=1 Tax=Enemella evansiae TaxID=2016499 RepID=UPI000B961641|nr:cytochrome P450 [Enemella evansiae]OYN98609.1 cytochrome P450 [Enemella evansiae]PFG65692.1 cytochrome P450 [Propionibacteriaceae bacterium ES.041]